MSTDVLAAEIAKLRATDKRQLTIYIVTILAAATLAVLSQRNTQAIQANTHRIAVAQYQQCQDTAARVVKINTTTNASIDFLSSLHPAPAGIEGFIKAYRAGILNTPDCGPRP